MVTGGSTSTKVIAQFVTDDGNVLTFINGHDAGIGVSVTDSKSKLAVGLRLTKEQTTNLKEWIEKNGL